MADFVQTMKDWRRMCKAYTTDDDSCCDGCPVVDLREHGCGAIFEMEDGTDWQKYADTIREWAVEHPEPVYPTWAEWLNSMGLTKHNTGQFCVQMPNQYSYEVKEVDILNEVAYNPIPADIAQKLGIEPKEG